MKRLFSAAALLCAVGLSASVHAQMTPVAATQLKMGGQLIPSGSVTLTPVNNIGSPLSVVTSDGVLNAPQGFSATITNGVIAGGFSVPDQVTSTATLANTPISYAVQVYNSASKTSFTFTIPASNPVVTGSTAFALDHYAPLQSAPVTPVGLLSGASVPAKCGTPSMFYLNVAPYTAFVGVNNVCVPISGGSGGSGVSMIAMGTVTSGATAAATLTGAPGAYTLNLVLPKGNTGNTGSAGTPGTAGAQGIAGVTPTFTVGTVTTAAAGSSAAATLTGTAPNYVLNLTIPQGVAGTGGGGASVTLLTNGTINGLQNRLNLVAGTGVTLSSDASGNTIVGAALQTDASQLSVGTLPNARLSSIPNSALANSAITINGTAVPLGGTTTIAGGSATTDAGQLTSGTLPNARLSAVPNSALANASITINGTAVPLGGSFTTSPTVPVNTLTTLICNGSLAIPFPASGTKVFYQVNTTANCSVSFTNLPASGTAAETRVLFNPTTFSVTFPASSSSMKWNGGSVPDAPTSTNISAFHLTAYPTFVVGRD